MLKKNGISNITFVTYENSNVIDNILNEFNSGEYSTNLLNEALNNYNSKYSSNYTLKEFAGTISKYASSENN